MIEFWFELASTYSHLAAQRVSALAREAQVDVVWRPFLLGPIFKAQGWNDSPFNVYPQKGAYMWKDVERQAAKYAIPFAKPSVFPRNGLLAARVALAAEVQPWIADFVRAVFLANFSDDADISDNAVIDAILREVGCTDAAALLAQAVSVETKELLRERNEQAVKAGIFGAPSFIVHGELYWGNDRLEDALNAARD